MAKRGRRSSADLAVPRPDGLPTRLQPPPWLGPEEAEVFRSTVSSVDPRHLVLSDLPVVCTFAESFVIARRAARELRESGLVVQGRTSPWLLAREKAVRELTSLSLRLRLCPQSRQDPKTTHRRAQGPPPVVDIDSLLEGLDD